MPHVVRIHETGGPEVLRWEAIDLPAPGPREVRIRHHRVGLNFIDVYMRNGLYPVGDLPAVLGMEGVGVVFSVGAEVTEWAEGDRVAYAGAPGAYAEQRNVPASQLVRVPEAVSDDVAAGGLLKGMTAAYLLFKSYPVQAGETILIHAAAGGVGSLVCQWARHSGATVIGTVGSPEKADRARALGCHHPIVYTREDFTSRVRDITDGQGVPVVYDSVGRQTFEGSLACLRPFGYLISFGQSSGAVPPFEPGLLARSGSLYLQRPSLMHYTADPATLRELADRFFTAVVDDVLRVDVNHSWPLEQAAMAHRAVEARETTGSIVLRLSG